MTEHLLSGLGAAGAPQHHQARADERHAQDAAARTPRGEPHPLEGVAGAGRGEVLADLPGDVRSGPDLAEVPLEEAISSDPPTAQGLVTRPR
ncbi:hypothetical protein [Streptomyces sp. NBC_01233]|uniref:hypothetical protein n=1 Tax=Streptomyces sp. NBC_01233 TaxID=2903787 RepID=UPI002E12EB87|nr:hypothetical protein OG332_02795 [Streptomyces sp. NBC_01233]